MSRKPKVHTNGNHIAVKEAIAVKFDLASGQNKREGFTGVDIAGTPDIFFDLDTYPWTFADDDSVDELWCSHYIEHTKDIVKFMDECWRIMKVGAQLTVIAPYYSSMRCWQDPTHVRAISEASFLYYNREWRIQNKLDHYPIKCDFDFGYGYVMHPDFASRNEETRAFAIAHYINVVTDIQVVLTKREKEG